MKKVIIVGSSKRNGDTEQAVKNIIKITDWDLINLNNFEFSYYDYEHRNKKDDFIPLMKKIIHKYDVLIFATPVYWYNMSGIMKVFFDRITDLLTIEKDLGRKLRGKSMAVISCSIGNLLDDTFWIPFSKSAEYLSMNYLGNIHISSKNLDSSTKKFIAKIENL